MTQTGSSMAPRQGSYLIPSFEHARVMVSHLLVVDSEQNQPVGVVSTLDIAGIVAWGRA